MKTRTDMLDFYHTCLKGLKDKDLVSAKTAVKDGWFATTDRLGTLDGIVRRFKDIHKAVDTADGDMLIDLGGMANGLVKAADDVYDHVYGVYHGMYVLNDFYRKLRKILDVVAIDAPKDVGDLKHLVFYGTKPICCIADLLDVLPDKIDPFTDAKTVADMVGKIKIIDLRPKIKTVYRYPAPAGYD